MTRALRDPRWLAGLAVAVVFAMACVWLAQWQLDRRVARAERNAAVLENYDASPVALADVVTDPDQGLPLSRQWQPVALTGTWDVDGTVLLRNRPQGGSNGYLVATPLDLTGTGPVTRVVVVRGWLPAGADAASPGAVPAPVSGTVDVVARLRPAEPPTDREAPGGQAYRLDADLLRAGGDSTLSGAYAVLETEDGAPPARLAPVPRPDTDPGPHLAYGVQWYLFALAGLGIWVVLARRHAGERDDRSPGADGEDGSARAGRAADAWVYEPGR